MKLKTQTIRVSQNVLIDLIAEVILDTIKSEIENTHFIAIKMDKCSDVARKSQLSTVFRYFKHKSGEVLERFVQFSDVSLDRTAKTISTLAIDVLRNFKVGRKLVA